MIEFHIEINSNLSLEKALFYSSCAHYKAVGLLYTNLFSSSEEVINIKKQAKELALMYDIEVFIGYKIMHIPPALIPQYADNMRTLGFDFIAVHGENINDIIEQGTNLAALNANADILLNAGIVDKNLLDYAKEKDTFLEFNVNPLYSSANALLAQAALDDDIKLIWGNTIQKESDFAYSLKRMQNLNLCPAFHINENNFSLLDKLNKDTMSFMHKIMHKN